MNVNRVKTIVMKDMLDAVRDGRIIGALLLPFAFALFFDSTWDSARAGGETALALSEHQQFMNFMLIPVVFLIILIAVFVVPIILAEEVEKKTLDVLVMIASYREVVIAKAAVGVLYVAVSLVLMFRLIGIIPQNLVLFGLATALLTVTLIVFGLLLGGLFRNANQLNTWSPVILMPLMIPTVFIPGTMTNAPDLPNWAEIALDANPVTQGIQLMVNGMTGEEVFGDPLRSIGIIIAWGAAGYLVLLWNLRRQYRAA